MIYDAINQPVAKLVGTTPSRILDLGCGTGALGGFLKSQTKHYICGVTYSETEAKTARASLDEVLVADLNTFEPPAGESYDTIICSHVLEHLYEPHEVLQRLRPCLRPEGRLIIALPNILFWRQRLKFLFGIFRYTDGGLLDSTHFRFFSYETALRLPVEGGFTIAQFVPDGSLPLSFLRRIFPKGLTRVIDQWAARTFPGLFGFQFLMVCRKA